MSNLEKIVQTIRIEVEEHLAYLDGNLTLDRLATLCKTNRTYVSKALTDMGGFFAYITKLRLAYFDAYRKEHPEATITQAALASGFGTRQTFYNHLTQARRI